MGLDIQEINWGKGLVVYLINGEGAPEGGKTSDQSADLTCGKEGDCMGRFKGCSAILRKFEPE